MALPRLSNSKTLTATMTNHSASLLPAPRLYSPNSSKRRKRKSPKRRRRRRRRLQRKKKRKRSLRKRKRKEKKIRRRKRRRRRVAKKNLLPKPQKFLLIRSHRWWNSLLLLQQTLQMSLMPSKEPLISSKRLSNLSPKITTRRARMLRVRRTKLQSIWRSKRKPRKS